MIPCKLAKVHGVLTDLSPMKKNYFEGRLGDSTKSMRNVGFSATKQEALAIHKGKAISLDRCELKKSRYGDDIEILVTNGCKVQKSPKKIPNLVESPENHWIPSHSMDKASLQTTFIYQ